MDCLNPRLELLGSPLGHWGKTLSSSGALSCTRKRGGQDEVYAPFTLEFSKTHLPVGRVLGPRG